MIEQISNYLTNLDHHLFRLINEQWTNNFLSRFFPFITDLHKNDLFVTGLVVVTIAVLWPRHRLRSLFVFVGLLFALATTDFLGNQLFKQNFERLRPGDNASVHAVVRSPYGGFSFISNHAANSFCFATFIYAFSTGYGFILFVVASLVAYSRVYNGVHFPSDVLIGAVFGIFIARLWVRVIIATRLAKGVS